MPLYPCDGYVNEKPTHHHKNIRDFARGNILLDVSGRKYSADVLIGYTDKGICVLYDVVQIQPTQFEYKKENTGKVLESHKSNSNPKPASSFNTIISKNGDSVNTESKEKRGKNKKGVVHFYKGVLRNVDDMTESQRETVLLAKQLASLTGIDIYFYDSSVQKDLKGKRGFFRSGDNSIHLDIGESITSKRFAAFTLSHEFTHFIRKWSPLKFKAFADFLVEQYGKHEDLSMEAAVRVMMKERNLGYDAAFEEVVANFCERMLLDSRAMEKLAELRKKDSSLFEKLRAHIRELVQRLRDILAGRNINNSTAEGLAFLQMKDSVEQFYALFEDAAVTAVENYQSAGGQNVENSTEVRHSADVVQNKRKITVGMSDSERTDILRNTTLKLVEYKGSEEVNDELVQKLKRTYNSEAYKILKKLGEKFGLFEKNYENKNIEVEFDYSRSSLRESVNKQGNIKTDYYDFAKMLYVFDEVVKNAVPIEAHTDKYKSTPRENPNLKADYVLISGFKDGLNIIPVEFHIKEVKENVNENNKLYVSITLGKIKIENTIKVHSPISSKKGTDKYTPVFSVISIPQLVAKINPDYGNFYKYIPSELLSDAQKASKHIAVNDENYRLSVMRGEDVSDILKARAKEKGYSFEEGTRDSKVYKKSSGSVKTTEVTYADNGELIPLSKRYNESKDDIRYSLEFDGISDRQVLASALESTIDTTTEAGRAELAQLREYKESIGTLAVFSVLALRGDIVPDKVFDIVMMVIAFYFGTQHEKNT